MIIQDSQFGDNGELGWGWSSFKKVGSAFKSIGTGAYNVAKMPAAMARRVATATAGVLCDKNGNPRGNDATSRNYCRAVKLKQQATLTKYLPAAAALASKGAQAQKIAAASGVQVTKPKWFGDFGKTHRAALSPFQACVKFQMDEMGATHSDAAYACQDELKGADPDMNLLASLAGADPDELSYALAGVTPVDIGAVAPADLALFGPSALAVGVGLWMLFRG
jgi:hypothetical protein